MTHDPTADTLATWVPITFETARAHLRDMVRIRRRLADAFVAQQLEGTRAPRSERTPSRDTLVFPV